MPTTDEPTEEHPRYRTFLDEKTANKATALYMVICDEGWRQTVVCSGMYRWAAEWIVEELQGKPYAPGRRP